MKLVYQVLEKTLENKKKIKEVNKMVLLGVDFLKKHSIKYSASTSQNNNREFSVAELWWTKTAH